jgi:hypothetical protein
MVIEAEILLDVSRAISRRGVVVPVPWRETGGEASRFPDGVPPRRGLVAVVAFVVTCAVMAGSSCAPGKAAGSFTTGSPAAQVRIFENGLFVGSGTLVARDWVLTALHVFDHPNNPAAYSMRFGVVNDQNDANDTEHLRSIAAIVPARQGDMAMVRLSEPVPDGTWTPRIAAEAPDVLAWGRLYGWGPDGHTLNRASTLVYDPVATANAAARRQVDGQFATRFPDGITPMVLDLVPSPGDSGSGIFVDRGTLTGVHTGVAHYLHVNGSGNLVPPVLRASFEQPVWQYRQWIIDTINGAGTSGSTPDPGDDEPRRRRLADAIDGDLPMTLPPQPVSCDEDAQCGSPTWVQATLLGAGNYRGIAQALCATAEGNSCSFNGVAYAAGDAARMALGPSSAPSALGTRQVMIWCRATPASSARQLVRVSFTNADPHPSPLGYGWWDVTSDQVGTGQTRLNTAALDPC